MPRKARACPACGADEETGWSEPEETEGADVPDADFDYEAYVEREFGSGSPKPRQISWFWWVTALLVLLGFLGLWVL